MKNALASASASSLPFIYFERPKRWLLGGLCAAVLVCQSVLAGPVVIAFAADVENTLGKPKTDFHVEMKSDTGMSLITGDPTRATAYNGAAPTVTPQVPPNASRLSLDWTVSTPIDGTGRLTVFAKQENKNDWASTAYFTPQPQLNPLLAPPASTVERQVNETDLPTLGWRVETDGRVYLKNLYTQAIVFSNFLFQRPTLLDNDSLTDPLDDPTLGFLGLLANGQVPASLLGTPGELLVGQVSLNAGDFLTGSFHSEFLDQSLSALTINMVLGHEHQAPVPQSLLLALTALGIWRMRRDR